MKIGLEIVSRPLRTAWLYGKVMHYVEVGMGVILVIVGFMLFFNVFQWISTYGQFFWIDFGL